MTVSRNDVVSAYRLLLGREPESEEVITDHARAEDLPALLGRFLGSAEFQRRVPAPVLPTLPLELPALDVDTDCSDEDAALCIAQIRRAWSQLGISRPHFSVLTEQRYSPENIAGSLDQFWQTGLDEATRVAGIATRHGGATANAGTCVEFGCGVGRVTAGLARHFVTVHAYDISNTHLALARRRLHDVAADNVQLHLCSDDPLAALEPCDLFYSAIVFQHNPPVIISRLISNALRSLKPRGLAIFQLPTYELGYRFKTAEWLAAKHSLDMQMHCLPQPRVFELVAEHNCTVMEVREDRWAGPPNQRLSNTFIVRKPPSPTPPPPPPPARR